MFPSCSASARGRCASDLLLVAAFLCSGSSIHAAVLPGLPPLARYFEEARSATDGLVFAPIDERWERLEVAELESVADRVGLLEAWSWWFEEDGWRGQAEDRAEDWLGLGELDLGTRRIRASKDLGDRLRLTTFTGYQSSSQRMLRAEYELGHGFVVRSEARERGESRVVIDREQRFR